MLVMPRLLSQSHQWSGIDPVWRVISGELPPLTHTSNHQQTLVDVSRFRVSPILTDSRFMRFCTCVLGVSDVSLVHVGVYLLCEFSSLEVDQGSVAWSVEKKALVKAHTMVH